MTSPELLYNGDKRLDTLEQAIMEVIDERARDQGIPYLSLIGLLDSIKFQILLEMHDD